MMGGGGVGVVTVRLNEAVRRGGVGGAYSARSNTGRRGASREIHADHLLKHGYDGEF